MSDTNTNEIPVFTEAQASYFNDKVREEVMKLTGKTPVLTFEDKLQAATAAAVTPEQKAEVAHASRNYEMLRNDMKVRLAYTKTFGAKEYGRLLVEFNAAEKKKSDELKHLEMVAELKRRNGRAV